MQTSDTSNLFQSDHSLAKASFRAAKSKLHAESGQPILLSTKPLRVVVRQSYTDKGKAREAEAWCAESGAVIRRIGLESGNTKQIFRGHTGPVTAIDFYTIPSNGDTTTATPREVLVSGSWDRSVRVWDTQTKTHLSTTLAHTDFIKALTVVPSLKILVTASSDKDIRIWDLTTLETRDLTALVSLPTLANDPESVEPTTTPGENEGKGSLSHINIPTGAAPPVAKSLDPLPFLLALKSHTRPIERLSSFPIPYPAHSESTGNDPKRMGLISVDSMGAMKIWELTRSAEGKVDGILRNECRLHENGIFDLIVGEGEIWTASGDNSVLLSTFDPSNLSLPPTPTLRIVHSSSLKSLLPLSIALPTLNSPHLLTGSTDEALRIFDLSHLDAEPLASKLGPWTGIPLAEGVKLKGMINRVEGHSHDIIDLGVYTLEVEVEATVAGGVPTMKREARILSASIDGTLRRWKWPDILTEKGISSDILLPTQEPLEESLLTAEEERELAEMMDE